MSKWYPQVNLDSKLVRNTVEDACTLLPDIKLKFTDEHTDLFSFIALNALNADQLNINGSVNTFFLLVFVGLYGTACVIQKDRYRSHCSCSCMDDDIIY